MNKLKILVLSSFFTALAAGFVAGVSWANAQQVVAGPGWLNELKLSTEQFKSIEAIWNPLRQLGREQRVKRDALLKIRDEKIQGLLTEDQKHNYSGIQEEYLRTCEQKEQEFIQIIDEAIERSKKCLSEEQGRKLDELYQKHLQDHNWKTTRPSSK